MRRSHNQDIVPTRLVEGELVSDGKGSGKARKAVQDGARAVEDTVPVMNMPEGTTFQGNSDVVLSRKDAGRLFEIVIADEVIGPFLPLSREATLVELVARETLGPPGAMAFEDDEREAGHVAQVGFVRSEIDGDRTGLL